MSPSSALYEPPAIRCFLSYAHDDEASLGFVQEFKSSLQHFAYADSGRRVEIFLDWESIGWGKTGAKVSAPVFAALWYLFR